MKFNRGATHRLRSAVSALFVVQLLIASFCMVTPAAAMEEISSGHCHKQVSQEMHHNMSGSQHDLDHVCAHCDSPQNLNTLTHAFDLTPAHMLLAYISAYAEIQSSIAAESFSTDKAQAPPDSSTLLLTTTQRIRI